MSFLVSLATGFLNESTEIMRNQAEFDREQAEKANLKKIELAKENRAFGRELIKKNLDASFATQKQYLKDVAAGNIKPVSLKTKSGMLTAMDMFGINQSYISQGKNPIYNVPSLYERIEKVENFGTMLGKGVNSFNFRSEFQTKPTWINSSSLLQQMSSDLGNNEGELARLKNSPPEVKAMIKGVLQGATQTYKDGFHKNTIGDFNPKDTLQIYPSESMYQEGNVFSGINKIKQALGMSTGIESDIIEAVDGVANKKVESSESGGVQQKYQTYFIANNKSYGGYNYPQEQKVGMEIVSKIAPANNFKYAGAAFLAESSIQDLTINDEEKIKLFNRGVAVASLPGARGLDPNRALLTYNQEEITKFNNEIYDGKIVKQGNIKLAAAVLMPIMEVPDEDKTSSYNSRFINYSGADYMSLQRFGSVPKGDKAKGDLATRYEALKNSVADLESLQLKVAGLNTTDAYKTFRETIIGVFSPSKGFVGDIIREFQNDSELKVGGKYDDGEDAITQDYLKELQDGVDKKTGLAAEIEALRISLAFKMARAADPSGRLSNQDIDLQLRRLGGAAFATPEFAVAQIDMVLKDFRRERDSVEVFYKYGQKLTRLTKNEARFIDGVIAANYINKKMQEYNNPKTGLGSDTPSVGVITFDNTYKPAQGYVNIFTKDDDLNFYRKTGETEDGKILGVIIPKTKENEMLSKFRIKAEGTS